MRLLIGNDDGIFAPGVRALANALAQAGHTITVVCPDRERSATGHALTLHKPLRVENISEIFHSAVQAWACSGTPSDCIKLALDALLSEPPELVLSGVNRGANLGTDVLYSGTVSAAMEGLLEGIPSLAISQVSYTSLDFAVSAQVSCELVAQIERAPLPLTLLNVNVPPIAFAELQGFALTRLGVRRYQDIFEKRVDPRGRIYYWLAGEAIEEEAEPDTDIGAVRAKQVSITPLHPNLTSEVGLKVMESWHLSLSNGFNSGLNNLKQK
ncbi:5'/3'-nucleotidase SurE [Leptolyngbya sp. FACHB-261]|uniref:5'/3'-nucleotidase SurE n=1 Tax=Leptolyngbya sp. FACHB-261 TaxID=2692806 RepID=UPI0016825925|nr:5'/3'-nucleotidase SurE [Leptolyngbya sp. FACHB-261]MBD2104615.1 5'/3'-nucleotidase SurE [Leptolyngbya sp. FACHB-261]